MLRIVICEDNQQQRQELHHMIGRILFDREDITVVPYEDGSELLKEVKKSPDFIADLIFLEIDMPRMDGLQTARLLREYQVRSAIVLVSEHGEYVFQGYEVHAFDYILKPFAEERLRKCLLRFLEEREKDHGRCLIISKRMGGRKIPLSQVRYFVSNRRKITAVMEKPHEAVEFYMRMNELEQMLEEMEEHIFLRCHQSFLINKHKVLYWDGSGISLTDQEKIPVSRRYKKQISALIGEQI